MMKDLGFVIHILGYEVFQDPNSKTLYMTQRRYILATLKRFLNKTELKKIGLNTSPMEASVALTCTTLDLPPDEQAEMQNVPHCEAIGSLLWLVAGARADIAYSVQTCAKFCSNPSRKHWKAALRILRYLYRTINYDLAFRKSLY